MTAGKKNPKLDSLFLKNSDQWSNEKQKLREIVLSLPLAEEMKWGQPCYTSGKDRNVLLIHGFKEYVALLFMKGALMKDPAGLLVQQTENVQSARQIRFTGLDEIEKQEDTLKAYIQNAIEIEAAGLKIEKKETKDFPVPDELTQKFAEDAELKKAFEALTPGRQRAWLLHFGQAKQSATRVSRIEKARPKILEGKGLLD
jgi:uncharacterized protein YdeI (YjbR/CyaY-like superfamily)